MDLSLNTKQWVIFGLTVATAVIHIIVGIGFLPGTLPMLFILNGLTYLALIAALYILPQTADQRGNIRWALMGFAALTIILYFVMNQTPFANTLGLVTKVIEVALIAMLWMESQ